VARQEYRLSIAVVADTTLSEMDFIDLFNKVFYARLEPALDRLLSARGDISRLTYHIDAADGSEDVVRR